MKAGDAETFVERAGNAERSDRFLILVLRLAALLCFAGWTWGHLYWEGPYGVLLWHDTTYDLACGLRQPTHTPNLDIHNLAGAQRHGIFNHRQVVCSFVQTQRRTCATCQFAVVHQVQRR